MNKYELIHTLETGTGEEKSAALESIRETQDVSLVHPLVDLLEKETSRAVKERILMVLNRLVPLSEFKDADRMLRSSDPFVRNGIVEIIQHANIPIIQFLEKLAEDDDKDVRKFVIDALSTEKSEQAIAIIRRRLEDPEINIRYTAVEYLGNFKDSASADKIETMVLRSDNFMEICAGLEALAKIQVSPLKEKVLKKFMNEDLNPAVIFPVLKYLGTFGTSDSFPYIEAIIRDDPETFGKEIIDAIEGIVKANYLDTLPETLQNKLEFMQLSTANPVNKYAVTKLLIRTGAGTGTGLGGQLPKMRQMLQDENEMMQLCAVEVLGDIGDESDIQRLEEVAGQTESDELLEAIGDAVMKIEDRAG